MDPGTNNADTEIHSLITGLFADLQNVDFLWEIGVFAVSLAAAWWVSRALRSRIVVGPSADPDARLKIGMGGLNRVIFPLSALLFLVLGRFVLHRFVPAVNLLNVMIPLLFSWMLVRLVVYVLRQAFGASGLLLYWERVIAWTIGIGLALHISGFLPELEALLDGIAFHVGKQRMSMLNILEGLLALAVTVVIAVWAGRVIEGRLMASRGLDPNLQVVLSKLTKTLLVIVAVMVALPAVGIDVTVLSLFGGALGVGIGFGLQKLAANYLSGFAILLDRSVSLGALVTIDGHYGQVTKLTARYIVVKGMDGTEALIPNDTVTTTVVVNHSYSDRRVRVDMSLQVSYQSDVERALALMLEAANAHPRVLRDPASAAVLKGFGDSGIDLALYVWILDPESGKGNLQSEIYLALRKSFNANGIQIPYPQREIRILDSAATEEKQS
jgi:small-conductance mechanosensitive channel